MEYIEVSFEITPFKDDFAEIIIAEIEELGFESYVTEEPFLKAYIAKYSFVESNLKTILSLIRPEDFSFSYSLNLIREQNWNAVWESSFEPVIVDGRCTIKASFHKGLPRTKYTITIDPKMAFGTGHHQTTTLIVKALLGMEKSVRGLSVLDMGCGTGILGILAAKMKASVPVHAIDIDPIAARSAIENSHRNRVGDKMKILCGDASLIQAGKYDLILANINRNIIIDDISTYARALRPGGRLITSGFYYEDVPLVEVAASDCGLSLVSVDTLENWAAVLFEKK